MILTTVRKLLAECELKPAIRPEEIAKKHSISVTLARRMIRNGTKVEAEHTSDLSVAAQIASHHVWERLDYYDRLEKAESED